MNIMLRTSGSERVGGRGEYELAGKQGATSVDDLEERPIFFEITPELVIPGLTYCLSLKGKQAKHRLRLTDESKGVHAQRLFRSLLFMPDPIRELDKTGKGPLSIENRRFAVSKINVDVAELDEKHVVLRPTALQLANQSSQYANIPFPQRMAQVEEIWRVARASESPLAALVRKHQDLVTSKTFNPKALEATVKKIQADLKFNGDFIELLAERLGIPLEPPVKVDAAQDTFDEEDDTTPLVARIRNLQRWRRQVDRGPQAAQFRRGVREAYNSVCAFSGARLPKISITNSVGVDAAHILPWASFELESVANGLCLSKHCHWAFDNGILRLDHISGRYVLSVPDRIRGAAAAEGLDLALFEGFLGEVPLDRFPSDAKQRPRPEYLQKLNDEIF